METEQNVRDYIRNDIDLDERDINIERAHRLPSKEKPRPVIVKFSFYKDREKILKTYKQKKTSSPKGNDRSPENKHF